MVLPLPAFMLHPYTSVAVAVIHVYLGVGHLWQLFGGDVQWTHIWKGFGALTGAYVFAALASRGYARRRTGPTPLSPAESYSRRAARLDSLARDTGPRVRE